MEPREKNVRWECHSAWRDQFVPGGHWSGCSSFFFPFNASGEKFAGERGEESLVGGSERPVEDMCDAEVGTQVDVEDKNVDVVSVDEVGVSGYESEDFTLSEVSRRKKLFKRRVSDSVVHGSRFPQCEFSNIQPLSFLLEFLYWPVIEFPIS